VRLTLFNGGQGEPNLIPYLGQSTALLTANIQPVIGAIAFGDFIKRRHLVAPKTLEASHLIGYRPPRRFANYKAPVSLCCCTPGHLSFKCHSQLPTSPFVPNYPRSPAAAPTPAPSLVLQSLCPLQLDERLWSLPRSTLTVPGALIHPPFNHAFLATNQLTNLSNVLLQMRYHRRCEQRKAACKISQSSSRRLTQDRVFLLYKKNKQIRSTERSRLLSAPSPVNSKVLRAA
jgi:hypothetical protein